MDGSFAARATCLIEAHKTGLNRPKQGHNAPGRLQNPADQANRYEGKCILGPVREVAACCLGYGSEEEETDPLLRTKSARAASLTTRAYKPNGSSPPVVTLSLRRAYAVVEAVRGAWRKRRGRRGEGQPPLAPPPPPATTAPRYLDHHLGWCGIDGGCVFMPTVPMPWGECDDSC